MEKHSPIEKIHAEELKKKTEEIEKADSIENLYNIADKEDIANKGKFLIPESAGDKALQLEDAKALQRHLASKEFEEHVPYALRSEKIPEPKISEHFLERLRKSEETMPGITQSFNEGLTAIRTAGEILLKEQAMIRKKKITRTRRGKIEQTQADFLAEKLIILAIKNKFPEDRIVSEEQWKKNTHQEIPDDIENEAIWYIDPLDGTRSYGSNRLNFATMLARRKNGISQFGIIFLPARGELYYAAKGTGAFMNNREIHVNKKLEAHDGFLELNQPPRPPGRMFAESELQPPVFSRTVQVECEGQAFVNLARGNTVAHVTTYTKPWDLVPGMVIVEEAGGKITDLQGAPYVLWERDEVLVASNGTEHETIIKNLKNAHYEKMSVLKRVLGGKNDKF